jgi:hypothetical protein
MICVNIGSGTHHVFMAPEAIHLDVFIGVAINALGKDSLFIHASQFIIPSEGFLFFYNIPIKQIWPDLHNFRPLWHLKLSC